MSEFLSQASPRMDLWLEERFLDEMALRIRVLETLFTGTSPLQRVDVVQTAGFGRMLLLDGLIMTCERDEFVYHEMASHVPLFSHPEPRDVLVVGGGDGGVVREVLKHPEVQTCTLVEVDAMVVEACREHLPWTREVLQDPRVELCVEDGIRFVAGTDRSYDVVVVDSTDPIGPAAGLFNAGFYADVHRVLRDPGIVVSQAESPSYYPEAQRRLMGILREEFERAHLYQYTNLTYLSGAWGFSFASDSVCPIRDMRQEAAVNRAFPTRYYTAALHAAAFQLPADQLRALEGVLTPVPGGAPSSP